MARYYRRRRRGYRKSTNTIMMKFQSFMDINTKKDEMQIISVSAGGVNILERLPAQFSAYKYYKIGNISVKLVPASTLPVDPTGLSYEEGSQTVDPRDQLSPGMMRITNGEDIFEDLTGMTAEAQHALFDAMQLDPRWYKWMLQRGVKRHATPRYWQIGQLHQDKWPGATLNMPWFSANGEDLQGTAYIERSKLLDDAGAINSNTIKGYAGESSMYGFFQTGHRGVLDWMPTDGMQLGHPMMVSPPEIEVMKIILPPAYKTEYYYRMYVSETVYFKEPKMMAMGSPDFPYAPLDTFVRAREGVIRSPVVPYGPYPLDDADTGGNYGDD